jgi:hypothetical protein
MDPEDNYTYELDEADVINDDLSKSFHSSNSSISLTELANELTISNTCVTDINRISRPTQTTDNEFADIKNVETIFKNLNKNLKTVYNEIRLGYNKKVNDSVQELHNTIIQQFLQIEKSYKQNLSTIRQAYHTELENFKAQFKNDRNEEFKIKRDKQFVKIENEKNYFAKEIDRLRKIINKQNNNIFRLKYILVQKNPGKVKRLFSEKNVELNDILDPKDIQLESAMQHLQVENLRKDNEIINLKKKMAKLKKEINKMVESETEYIAIEKHKRIIKELKEDYEMSRSSLEKEKK